MQSDGGNPYAAIVGPVPRLGVGQLKLILLSRLQHFLRVVPGPEDSPALEDSHRQLSVDRCRSGNEQGELVKQLRQRHHRVWNAVARIGQHEGLRTTHFA